MRLRIPVTYLCTFLIYTIFTQIFPQGQADPYNWTKPVFVQSNDIFLLWNENATGTYKSYQKVYRYKIDSTFLPADSMISKTPRQEDSRTSSTASQYCDASSGRFNRDPFDDVVGIWQNQSGLEITIPKFDTTKSNWTITIQDSINNTDQGRSYVRTGDFDGDSLDEFIIAYLDSDDSVHINFYDVDSTLKPTLISSICDEKLVAPYGFQFIRYFIETGDFNGDGIDDLALFAVEIPPPSGAVQVKVKIYDYSAGSISPEGQTAIDVPRLTTLEDFVMAATSGNFKNDSKDELAFISIRSSEGVHYAYNYLLEVSKDLQSIIIGPRLRITPADNNTFTDLSLASGDLNNYGRDEVVFTNDTKYYIMATDDNLTLTLKNTSNIASGGTNDYLQSYNCLKIKDVNQDNRDDIIIVKNFVQNQFADGFFVAIIAANDALDSTVLLGRLFGDEPQSDVYQPYSIAVGNFDGCDFTIGQPSHYTKSNVVQTLVVLNAPPVHFDVLNGQTYDVNQCYNGGDCDFFSQYIKSLDNKIQVSTKVNRDWEVSAGVHLSGDISVAPWGVGTTINYEAYFLHKWGKHFSKDSTSIKEVTFTESNIAKEDDEIYATVSDYDLWEYPFYYGNEKFPRATIMTFVPNNVRGQWFPSKSYSALSYIPDHEVGNILSYFPYDTLENNPNVEQTIKADYVADSKTLSANSSNDFTLNFNDFTSNKKDTTQENSNTWGFSFGVEVTGDFGNTTYTTHTTSVTTQIQLDVHLGSVNMGIGDVKYTVTPYTYWAKNGALILDYAVKPELAPPGYPNTWWQDMYSNNSDPTFILPWHLDPEKGFPVSEQAKRYQSSDIVLYPQNPLPGDTLTITAHVRNYSLIPTPSPVSVEFYIGDPDSGGVPIIGINGTNKANTIGPVLSRGRSDVELKWIIPSGLPSYPRIYALLDQENSIAEIHENNNKGFNVLGRQSITGAEDKNNVIPNNYSLDQSYPNPFNPTTTIKYSVPSGGIVNLTVYDILGREVAVLVNGYITAGKYSVDFNGSNFASGVYFYQLKAGSFVKTMKMILLK